MKRFAALYARLDATTSTSAKVDAMAEYFAQAAPPDAAWAAYMLAGGKPRQVVPTARLRALACELAGLDEWLFEECYQAVGDLAETIALVLPDAAQPSDHALSDWMEQRLLPLRGLPETEQSHRLRTYWRELDGMGRFLLTKLVGGGFRVGVSRLLVQRALAQHAGLDAKLIAQRMMGYTDGDRLPTAARYMALVAPLAQRAGSRTGTTSPAMGDIAGDMAGDMAGDTAVGTPDDPGQPYPFFLAHPLDVPAHDMARLGPTDQWLLEWKYDGIRGQIVRRAGQTWIWSRGEELLAGRFPEVEQLCASLPDGTVLDGEILAWLPGASAPAPFSVLQQRIGRKTLTRKVLAQAPARFIAYDLLEDHGADLRARPQHERRQRLQSLLQGGPLELSPLIHAMDWAQAAALRAQARSRGVEGLMLKHREAAYGVGRTRRDGVWLKWKTDPLSVDCVLVYAQAGHGRRASVYTDYTFAVWSHAPQDAAQAQAVADAIARREPAPAGAPQLVPFAKAYSGLTDEEFRQVDAIIRKTTLEKFGPVRQVRPTLVFELGFEGIGRSTRHKSGFAVRFPRMLRIRHDKPLHGADTLQDLHMLLNQEQSGEPAQGPPA